jgi:2-hydroxycyclohexanecarboxyl-CoA dehydrogenase
VVFGQSLRKGCQERAVARLKTAVVTGGASGIGRAVAERLRKDGLQVAVIDLSPSDDGFGHIADVTDRAQVDKAVAAIREQFGPILVLVNAAGVEGFQKFSKMSFAEWSKVIDVNLNGVFHTIQAVLPDMVDAGWGRIVNISSSSTHSGQPFMAHYVAAKSAVNGLTKSLALEYGPAGITVNAVPPGFVDTPMLRSAESRHLLGGTVEDHINRTPVRRVGRPEDIAAACAFFASEEAGYITGQILGVNGGRNT